MSEIKHTPGPWNITKLDDGVLMCHTEGDTICFGDPNHQDPPDDANFALIAAAPDLLEQLKNILGRFENCALLHGNEEWVIEAATAKARAAIAKAEGRAE